MANTKRTSPRVRALGAELREYRESAGMTVRDVSMRLGGHHSKIARLETGHTPPTPEMVVALLTTYGASESERDRLATMARDATDESNWIKPKTRSVNQDLTTLIEFERTATSIIDVSPIMIPGPLQTADYARAVMAGGTPPEELEAQVTMRVGRRDVLTRRNAPQLYSYIGEWALREPIGSAEIMADQLRHLIKMAELDNVTMRVVPSRTGYWTPAHAGHFLLFEFAKAAPVVHVEHLRSDAFLSSPGEIEAYHDAATNLRDVAMSPEDSAELIASIATELEDNQK
ncbi:transcriptional regulator with XRE-family HTH domain [Actinopolyspora biskrensis]|uniref:Transcriptional regulator with XRE-family HTH domain n=1 Tax=Actinopolyspora biskrensis TaxID=1470178 RepID=A0A852Z176_9ACTN|nr:helix-turn-helix transcriptional regulator [Actinopolyspora biskrensis]NYH77406.1 transcriptional regulator with XRE-family HTH domain [Actinopolyspora biskrensis]